MFNIGFSEVIAIGVIALIVIGPKQLPEVARVVARLMKELKKATQDLSGGLLEVTREVKNQVEDTKSQIFKEGQKIVDSMADHRPHDDHHPYDDHHAHETFPDHGDQDQPHLETATEDQTKKPGSDG